MWTAHENVLRVDRLAYHLSGHSSLLRDRILVPLLMRHVMVMVFQWLVHCWSPNQKVWDSSTDQGHPVTFLGKLSYSDSLPGVFMDTIKFNAGGFKPVMDWYSISGEMRNTPSHFMLWNKRHQGHNLPLPPRSLGLAWPPLTPSPPPGFKQKEMYIFQIKCSHT